MVTLGLSLCVSIWEGWEGRDATQTITGVTALSTPWLWASSLQNYETIHFCCFRLPRSWYFVIAALGDYYNLWNAYTSAWHIKIHTCYCYNSGTIQSRSSGNIIRNFFLFISQLCFLPHWLHPHMGQLSGWLTLRVASGNSSLRYYQFSSPSKKTHLFLSISSKIPAKWIPLVITRLHTHPWTSHCSQGNAVPWPDKPSAATTAITSPWTTQAKNGDRRLEKGKSGCCFQKGYQNAPEVWTIDRHYMALQQTDVYKHL